MTPSRSAKKSSKQLQEVIPSAVSKSITKKIQLDAESPSQRFARIADFRVQYIVERVRILSKLANRFAYEYTKQDIDNIFGSLREEIDIAERKFRHDLSRKQASRRGVRFNKEINWDSPITMLSTGKISNTK